MRTAGITRLFAVLATALLSAGCVAHAHGRAHGHAYAYAEAEPPVVFYEPPMLVAIDSGVWVVPRYHTTVYYVDDTYWCHEGGIWYRSSHWEGAWVAVNVSIVPRVIVHRTHSRYVHYEAAPGAEVRRAPAHATVRRDDPPGHRARKPRKPYPGYATPDETRPEHPRKKHRRRGAD
jgi:hypothetical protein